jgi:hypothetical protein
MLVKLAEIRKEVQCPICLGENILSNLLRETWMLYYYFQFSVSSWGLLIASRYMDDARGRLPVDARGKGKGAQEEQPPRKLL